MTERQETRDKRQETTQIDIKTTSQPSECKYSFYPVAASDSVNGNITAGALVAHLPEVVLAVEGQDPLRRQVLRPVQGANRRITSVEHCPRSTNNKRTAGR